MNLHRNVPASKEAPEPDLEPDSDLILHSSQATAGASCSLTKVQGTALVGGRKVPEIRPCGRPAGGFADFLPIISFFLWQAARCAGRQTEDQVLRATSLSWGRKQNALLQFKSAVLFVGPWSGIRCWELLQGCTQRLKQQRRHAVAGCMREARLSF